MAEPITRPIAFARMLRVTNPSAVASHTVSAAFVASAVAHRAAQPAPGDNA